MIFNEIKEFIGEKRKAARITAATVVLGGLISGCVNPKDFKVYDAGLLPDQCTASTELKSGETPLEAARDRCIDPGNPEKPAFVVDTRRNHLRCIVNGVEADCNNPGLQPETIIEVTGPCGVAPEK